MPPAPVTVPSTAPSPLPEWLVKGRSEAYIYDVFAALSTRERDRHYARTMSLGGSGKQTSSQVIGILPREDNEHDNYYSAAIGGNLGNQWANRYSNIWPYDRTRVIVGRLGGCTSGSDEGAGQGRYFNGNWVKELHGERIWIATQAPLRETAHSFLSIIARPIAASPPSSAIDLPAGSRIRTVVQLTVNVENGRQKASSYFPSDVKPMMRILPEPDCNAPAFRVALLEQKIIKKANCVQSKISIIPDVANPGEPVVFTHMMYMAWPDQGVPEQKDLASLLYFIRLVDFVNRTPTENSNDEPGPPLMVHCSAGVGRTGTFITLVSLLRTLGLLSTSHPALQPIPSVRVPHSPLGPLQKEIQDDPVAQEIDNLREQRPRMVERIEQMQLIYEILELAISEKSFV
ncbi:hypothetical protein SCLCIDRAFT_1207329 [Scleroderma citrinum Foug A]|uniref:Tyrosine specific protein phosphatases domain-containing protein n=1 Tax=Scleroderma citrinum Foug A TaxID=1036808 RepID=A0A0C3AYJ0_9AGAM|nr:hypothetical protein SCLCIDRAFT_1207329 [Scleroderma citrinum Foug A]